MHKISVAMTTYNGEKYLIEQLKSLSTQVRKPDEVIICDDNSIDNTVSIIKDFIRENNLELSWKLYVNKTNKGYKRNFFDCFDLTTGDIVFFCDQDDIWHSNKISKMMMEFEKNSNIQAMCCTLSVIDEQGNVNNTLFNKLRMGNGKLNKIEFKTQVKNNFCGGLTLAVQREVFNDLRHIILKYNLPYDVPVGLFTSIDGGFFILGIPLVFRRIHLNNISTPKYTMKSRLANVERHIDGRRKHLELLKICFFEKQYKLTIKDKKNLLKMIDMSNDNLIYLNEKKFLPLLLNFFSLNPMVNRLVIITNALCVLFGNRNSTY